MSLRATQRDCAVAQESRHSAAKARTRKHIHIGNRDNVNNHNKIISRIMDWSANNPRITWGGTVWNVKLLSIPEGGATLSHLGR